MALATNGAEADTTSGATSLNVSGEGQPRSRVCIGLDAVSILTIRSVAFALSDHRNILPTFAFGDDASGIASITQRADVVSGALHVVPFVGRAGLP